MLSKRIVAIDPSKWGTGTSGTGIAIGSILITDGHNDIDIHCTTIMGKDHTGQEDYNIAIIEYLEAWKHELVLVVLEEYQDYNKASTKFQVNGTAEMIGVIKYWCYMNQMPMLIRNAAAMKRRLPDDLMEEYGWIKDGQYISHMTKEGKVLDYTKVTKNTRHWYDAYRHLMMTLWLSKEGKELLKNE